MIDDNNDALAKSSEVVRQSYRFQRNFLYMSNGLRIYLLSNEHFFLQTYDSALQENKAILRELMVAAAGESEQRILLEEINKLQEFWVNEFADPLLKAKKMSERSDSSMPTFKKAYHEKFDGGKEQDLQNVLKKKFSVFTNQEYGVRNSRKEALMASIENTERISIYLTLFSIVAGSLIAIMMAYYISSRIMNMVKMAQAITQGNFNVHVQENGNSEFGQLGKALNEMAKMLDKNISLLKRQKEDLDQFAHVVSHELKAPLRGIDNVVTWIEEDHSFSLPPKVNEYLDVIKGRITRAENLLRGVLMYARTGQEVRPKEHVHIREVLDEVLEYIPTRDGISVFIQPDMPLLYTERLPLVHIFTNLIGNAVKHHNKEKGVVKVYYRDRGEHYEFFVVDDGPGISGMFHERIFRLFQTLQESNVFESQGIGLAIVKKILDDRKLPIKLYSEPGQGSTFSFLWPKYTNY